MADDVRIALIEEMIDLLLGDVDPRHFDHLSWQGRDCLERWASHRKAQG